MWMWRSSIQTESTLHSSVILADSKFVPVIAKRLQNKKEIHSCSTWKWLRMIFNERGAHIHKKMNMIVEWPKVLYAWALYVYQHLIIAIANSFFLLWCSSNQASIHSAVFLLLLISSILPFNALHSSHSNTKLVQIKYISLPACVQINKQWFFSVKVQLWNGLTRAYNIRHPHNSNKANPQKNSKITRNSSYK